MTTNFRQSDEKAKLKETHKKCRKNTNQKYDKNHMKMYAYSSLSENLALPTI
jgi:hypothetical protein